MGRVYIIGTYDTKGDELSYVNNLLKTKGIRTCTVDVSTRSHNKNPDVRAEEVASYHPSRPDFLKDNKGRGDAVTAMAEALEIFVLQRKDVLAVLGLGGSGGTSLVTRTMRSLPVGIPKVMVSTVASGNVRPYVGESDIFMLYSVTDIAGINRISATILGQAAHAMVGMVQNALPEVTESKPVVGMTMFGVTTPCIEQMKAQIQDRYECLIFHATGSGGRSMEKLIDSGFVQFVIDITTTEICDLLMGGVLSAGEERMDSIIRTGVPYVVSVGACDMVNFGAIETVPESYRSRNLYVHNPQVTLMRTTPDENRLIGEWIAVKLNQMTGPVNLLLPEKGVSALSVKGQPFYDPEADQALFETLEDKVEINVNRQITRIAADINDPAFARAATEIFLTLIEST
ncbi:MAG: Tm-1-like ATP-binding domain-containing protein [Saprospiraceae bacterium]|nr:Tm-1-like ATP-binding domain-containing protein [Saprospiraceae bacterium]